MVTVTENAASEIRKLQEDTGSEEMCLRISVMPGGCSGNEYRLGFDNEKEGDIKFESNGVTLLTDLHSLSMMDGTEIDYVKSLQGSNFVFSNPKATGGCGCGQSFN